MEQKLKLELIKKLLKKEGEEGFSLLELVVVVVVLAILSAIGLPYFLSFIDQAIFQATKTSLNQSYTTCRQNPDQAPTGSPIPGVVFQQSNCASEMSATINSKCTLSMNMSTGVRTGWSDFYGSCVSATTIANSKPNTQVTSNTAVVAANDWRNLECSNSASDVVPEYMSKGDKRFLDTYEVLQKWLSIPSNINKTDSLPNSQSGSNRDHSFTIGNKGELTTWAFIDENQELKSELEKLISSNSKESNYRFDIWINPREKPCGSGCTPMRQELEKDIDFSTKLPRISVRRLGPQGYWRTAGHEVSKCN